MLSTYVCRLVCVCVCLCETGQTYQVYIILSTYVVFVCETGQTYQESASTYEKLHAAKSKKRSRAAEVILDGSESDYLTTDVLSADCKFSSFEVITLRCFKL